MLCCYLAVLLWLGVPVISSSDKGLEFPSHDGKRRLINLSKKNFNRFLKKYDILVVYFTIPTEPGDAFQERQWQLTEEMLELVSQITEREGIGYGIVDLEKDRKLAEKLGIFEGGSIYAFKSGHRVLFDGQRSADVLVEFVLELDEHPVEEINTKVEVQGFRRNELMKVVGYFETSSTFAYDEFVDAALNFQPMVPFYAVFQKQIAKQLGLTELNQIDFYEPYMKKPLTIPGEGPLDNVVVEEFVESHKRATLRKLRPLDMYTTWEDDVNGVHVVAFADVEDPEGYEFLQMIKEVAQQRNDNPDLSMVWIDPDDFTLLHDYWERTFGIDLSEPHIGLVNVTDADSIWLERRKSRLPTMAELEKWISDVLIGKINTEDDDNDYNLEDDDEDEDRDDENGDAPDQFGKREEEGKDNNVDDKEDSDDDESEMSQTTKEKSNERKRKTKNEL